MMKEKTMKMQEPCEDAVSREDKKHIDGFKYWCETNEENNTITIPKFVCDEIVEILDKFSSVTPSRPKGHWIEELNDYEEIQGWHCSNCYEDTGFTTDCATNFCPKCGAKMIGELYPMEMVGVE